MKHKAKRRKPTHKDVQWQKQAAWVVKYLEKLPESPSAHGLVWTTKMVAHYTKQFDALMKQAPRSCKKQARAYKARIDTVRAWSQRNS